MPSLLPLHVLVFEKLNNLVSDLYFTRSLLTLPLNEYLKQLGLPSMVGYTRK